ncbi:hypothetical protein HanIR_Chr16g0806991 [Helianthus annuus]|nr:hypothetical protein HanIR_Chr16g0806991 [Helianthus annuus]
MEVGSCMLTPELPTTPPSPVNLRFRRPAAALGDDWQPPSDDLQRRQAEPPPLKTVAVVGFLGGAGDPMTTKTVRQIEER